LFKPLFKMSEQQRRATSALSWIKSGRSGMRIPAATLAAVELFVATGEYQPREPRWVTEARVGIMQLTGSSPARLADQLALFLGRIKTTDWPVPTVAEIAALVSSASLFGASPSSNYVRVLNAYLRGKELLFELGMAPVAHMDEKFSYDAEKDNVLATDSGGKWKETFAFGPLRFSCWEAEHRCIGFPLREFGDSLPFGVHFAHIIGCRDHDHISEMVGRKPRAVGGRGYPTTTREVFPKTRRYFSRGGRVSGDGEGAGLYAATFSADIDSMRVLFTAFGQLFGCNPDHVKCVSDTLDARSKYYTQ
jgi:hypothetical protein